MFMMFMLLSLRHDFEHQNKHILKSTEFNYSKLFCVKIRINFILYPLVLYIPCTCIPCTCISSNT